MKKNLLYVEQSGSGPTLVLLHGYLTSSRYWDKVVPELTKHFTVIAIDLLGFGKSSKPKNARYDVAEQMTCIHETLLSLGVGKGMVLVGHSMGALVAAGYALQYPGDLKKLFLVNPPIFLNQRQARQDIQRTKLGYNVLLYRATGRIIWPLLKLATARQKIDDNPRRLVNFVRDHSHYSRRGSLTKLIEQTHVLDQLEGMTVPTTIIMGHNDRPIYKRNLAQHTKPLNAKLVWLDSGHHSLLDLPDSVLAELIKT